MDTTLRHNFYYVQVWIEGKFQIQMAFYTQEDANKYAGCVSKMRDPLRVDIIQFNTIQKDKS